MASKKTGIDVSKLEKIEDDLGNVLGYVKDETVIDDKGEVIGEIDENGDAVFHETEEVAQEIAQTETYESASEPGTLMETVDEYINVLHSRGLALMDPPAYPSDEIIAAIKDPATKETQQLLQQLLDGLINEIDFNDLDTISNFGRGRTDEMMNLAIEILENEDMDGSLTSKYNDAKKEVEKIKNDDFFGQVASLADRQAGKAVDFVKNNPGKAAAVGAAGLGALVVGPLVAAGGAAAAFVGSKLWKRKQENQEDELRREAHNLAKELKNMRARGDKAFGALEESAQQIHERHDNSKRAVATLLLGHRRTCVFLSAAREVERRIEQEILPVIKAEYQKNQTEELKAQLEIMTNALEAVGFRVNSLQTAYATSVGEAQRQRNMQRALAMTDMKIKDHLTETRAQWTFRLSQSIETLRTLAIIETVDDMDKLSDEMVEAGSDMDQVTGALVKRSAERAAVDPKLVAQALERTADTAKLLASTGAGKQKADRALLTGAVKHLNDTAEEARKQRLLPPSAKGAAGQRPAAEQDNGGTPRLAKPGAAPAGGVRRVKRAPKPE